MATKKTKKGESVTWTGKTQLRVLMPDDSTEMQRPGATFTPHADWLAAVRERQPEKAKLLK